MSTSDRRESYTTTRQDIASLVPNSAIRILDVGCSNGALGQHLKSLTPERKVFGIEFDSDFADTASHRLDLVITADLNTMNLGSVFDSQPFDCIVFADVLEHLIDPKRCLTLALQRLVPGGCVIISLPNVRHVTALWNIFVVGTFPRRERGIFDKTHLHWFTYKDAEHLLLESGLQVTSESFSMRWRDRGGGLFNRMLNRLPLLVQRTFLFREFFAYQICFRAQSRKANE